MDKQQNELIKSYARVRKIKNQPRFYEVNYALSHPKFDIIDYDNFKQLDKVADFIAKNPAFIEKFKKQLRHFTSDQVKVIIAYQPQLHPHFKHVISRFLFSSVSYVLDRQIGAEEFRSKLKIKSVGTENIIDILGSYGVFENLSSNHMSKLLIKYPEIYETVKKYFKMKFLDGGPLFNLLIQYPEFIDKEELDVNTISEDNYYDLLIKHPELEKHPKVVNYKHKKMW